MNGVAFAERIEHWALKAKEAEPWWSQFFDLDMDPLEAAVASVVLRARGLDAVVWGYGPRPEDGP